jgi:hypothetical protein
MDVLSQVRPRAPRAKPPLGLARTLRDDVYKVTAGRPMRWVMVGELGLRHPDTAMATLDAALTLAIEKGWMTGEGSPVHSVMLTDEGRRLSE